MKSSFLLVLTCLISLISFAQSDKEMVESTIRKSDIEGHIYFLASDELKGRQTGSHELNIAAAYLANTFRKLNVSPGGDNGSYYQKVPMIEVSSPESIHLKLNGITGSEFLYLKVKNTSFQGDAIYLNYGDEASYQGKEVKGQLVVVKAGSEKGSDMRSSYKLAKDKRELAKKMGAVGLVELIDAEDKSWNNYAHYFNEPKTKLKDSSSEETFLHLWMKDKNLSAATNLSSTSSSLKADLKIEGIESKHLSTKNVIGFLEGTDPKLKDQYVIYSAHYDHVGIGKPNAEMDSIYNGARDNAVGTVTVLSAAENFSKYPTKRSALFILFTGEEKGLLGSKYYVENPVIPLNKMIYCFNSDNGGYNDTSKATIIGLNRTTAGSHILKSAKQFGLTAIDDPAPEQGLFDRSDNVHFATKGIPAPTYCMGFTSFDEEITKYYHQVTDNPETLDYDYLTKFFKSYVLASRYIANDPKIPFWVEGDKYYEAGKKLYEEKEKESKVLD